ncbi:MAG: hypothetical protein J7L03_05565 [Caldisericaceae bacterium]|jgi:hypothetical protein|nr:hypothetical protein [Caldisericaceae bacterium]
MDKELKEFFKKEYDSVKVPHGLKERILRKENKRIYLMAAVSASAFVVFIFMLATELSAQFDSIISGIALP